MSKQTDLINIPDAITVSGSNVGIGTSSPNRNLHVSGGAGDVAFGITNAATGTASSDGFSITVENPTPDVAIRQRENNNMKFLTNNTERMRILSGGGITFNGDTAAANALNDYEEGTWTPTLGGSAVYNIQQGTYTKIGRVVTINFGIRPSSIGTGSTFRISGIPFPHLSGYSTGLSIAFYDGVSTTTVGVTGEVYNSVIDLYPKTTATSGISNTTAFFQSNARFYASATYITSQ